ncbi:MAG: phosphatidylserine decarboxylase [Candidatus Binatota bacterium]|nr:phosphatidylserine decarboxylase [Candidatus Binatota bacterium]
MKFAHEGIPFVFASGGITLLIGMMDWWWVGFAALGLTLFFAWFFRDPDRLVPEEEGAIVAPADGRVVAIEPRHSAPSWPGVVFQRVSIFMSPLDVHVNRVPASGEVVSVCHSPGRFRAAYLSAASSDNERNEIAVRDAHGHPLAFVQIAGWMARRIVCRLRPGEFVERGARFGMILFGSRMDVYVPESATIRVAIGDRVRGGSDVVAIL